MSSSENIPPVKNLRALAEERSPVLGKFLSEDAEQNIWFSDLLQETNKVMREFDKRFDDRWGIDKTNPFLIRARLDGMFPPEAYIIEERLNELRLITVQLFFIGWQLEPREDLINHTLPAVRGRVASLPFLSADYRDVSSEVVANYVQSCIYYGAVLGGDHKIQPHDGKEPDHGKLEVYQDFIEGLDLEGFTGK